MSLPSRSATVNSIIVADLFLDADGVLQLGDDLFEGPAGIDNGAAGTVRASGIARAARSMAEPMPSMSTSHDSQADNHLDQREAKGLMIEDC